MGIEQHVVDLGVAMADALWQLALAVQLFGSTHLLSTLEQSIDQLLHLGNAARLVVGNGIVELLEAELHVMEVRNGLVERLLNIGKHGLELAEALASKIRILRIDNLVSHRIRDEHRDSPVGFTIEIVGFSGIRLDECEDLAVKVGNTCLLELGTDM